MENIYKILHQIAESGQIAALCTIIESKGSTPRKAGSKMLVLADKTIYGTIGGGNLEHLVIKQAQQCLNDNTSGVFHFNLDADAGMSCGGQATIFIEPVQSKKKVVIFGAGHIGSFLAQLAHNLNFAVTLIDEREDIFKTNLASEIHKIIKPYNQAVNDINPDQNTYVCVITHKHDYDKEIVAALGAKKLGFLGMIGSKRKIATITKEFIENKVLTDEQLQKINWPMGIDIRCQTPEEIAVSILAKLVDIRNAE